MVDYKSIIALIAGYTGLIFVDDTYNRQVQLDNARIERKKSGKPLLNISCGKTDFGDINADIIPQEVSNFVLFKPNEPLPFNDKIFGSVYSAHTLEHSDDPIYLLQELERVSDTVFLALPPFWAITVYNPSHKWIPLDSNGLKWFKNPLYSKDFADMENPCFSGNPLVK
jgi:SAM-dependent methyltransferase